MRRIANRYALCTICILLTAMAAGRSPPQTAPSPQPATPADARLEQIRAGVDAVAVEIQKLIESPKTFMDPARRAEVGPKIIPHLKQLDRYGTELSMMNNPDAMMRGRAMAADARFMLAVFGDADAMTRLQRDAGAPDLNEAHRAQATLISVRWILASADPAAQSKAIDDLEALAKSNPLSNPVAVELMKLAQLSTNPDTSRRIDGIIATMRAPAAAQWAQMSAQRRQVEDARAKLRAMEKKPFVISGPTIDGMQFTTADWKGKVILVDFWAARSVASIADLPRVQKVYKDFHDKGLEVVGVSCDGDAESLKSFIAQNADVRWPQLFDAKNSQLGWHPLALGFGIDALPAVLLIDRDGNLRSANANDNFEELIPTLLAETAK